MEISKNQMEFEKMFATEEKCLAYLQEFRFLNGYACRKCGHTEHWVNKRGLIICKYFKDEFSITAGTIFHRSKSPLTRLFRALWWMDGQKVLPNVHRIASLLKRWLLGTHQNFIGEQYLSCYLEEYTYRHNRRKSNNSRSLLFQRLIEQEVLHVPVEYKSIKSM